MVVCINTVILYLKDRTSGFYSLIMTSTWLLQFGTATPLRYIMYTRMVQQVTDITTFVCFGYRL